MFISQSFIFDLRRADHDLVASSIFAANLADSFWEYALFIASSKQSIKKTINWSIYVIDPNEALHLLLSSSSDFSFPKLKEALTCISRNSYLSTIPTERINGQIQQNPLSVAIDLCSLSANSSSSSGPEQPFFIFIQSSYNWSDDIGKTVRRVKLVKDFPQTSSLPIYSSNSSFINFTFVIISDDEEPKINNCAFIGDSESNEDLAKSIADKKIGTVIKFANRDDCFFQFFRSICERLFFQPVHDFLEIGQHLIECQRIPLLLPETEITPITTCKCHNLPIIDKPSKNCPISNKKVSKSQLSEEFSVGGFIIPYYGIEIHEISIPKLVAKCRIATSNITESILIGASQILVSDSPKFHRLLNELRCTKEAVVAMRVPPGNIVGGEYFLIVADSIDAVLHCKKIANRAQVLKFDSGKDAPMPIEICTVPILQELTEIDQISPYILGREIILKSSGMNS